MTNIYALYVEEIASLPREADLPIHHLIEQARTGDSSAKQQILHALLRPILLKARSWRLADQEMCMELAAIGNCTMVEHFERLIIQEKPIARLMARAYGEMKDYLCYKHYLIRKPSPMGGDYALEFLPVWDESDIAVQRSTVAEDSSQYELLYGALDQLGKNPRQLLIESYGLYGEPCKSISEIAGVETCKDKAYHTVKTRRSQAIRQMRTLLTPTYQQRTCAEIVPEYAHILIPDAIRARLDTAYDELVANGVSVSRNKLVKQARTTPYYASAYLWQFVTPAKIDRNANEKVVRQCRERKTSIGMLHDGEAN